MWREGPLTAGLMRPGGSAQSPRTLRRMNLNKRVVLNTDAPRTPDSKLAASWFPALPGRRPGRRSLARLRAQRDTEGASDILSQCWQRETSHRGRVGTARAGRPLPSGLPLQGADWPGYRGVTELGLTGAQAAHGLSLVRAPPEALVVRGRRRRELAGVPTGAAGPGCLAGHQASGPPLHTGFGCF